MAFKYMTGETCGNGQVLSFIADDTNISANDIVQLGTGLCVEITILGAVTTANPTVTISTIYADCNSCLSPISANTEQVITYFLNSDINNGDDTVRTFTPPHPVWLNGQNHSVSQLNMVTLGGNGLNS